MTAHRKRQCAHEIKCFGAAKGVKLSISISIRHFDHIYNFGFLKVHAVIKGMTK
jgi:hypothetical protein